VLRTGNRRARPVGVNVRRQQMPQRPFYPSKEDARKFCLVMGFVFFALVAVELLAPRATAPTGRWSWIAAPIYEAFGSFGLAVV